MKYLTRRVVNKVVTYTLKDLSKLKGVVIGNGPLEQWTVRDWVMDEPTTYKDVKYYTDVFIKVAYNEMYDFGVCIPIYFIVPETADVAQVLSILDKNYSTGISLLYSAEIINELKEDFADYVAKT